MSTQKEANEQRNYIKRKSSRDEIPKRAYFCKECKAWHLTNFSTEKGKYFNLKKEYNKTTQKERKKMLKKQPHEIVTEEYDELRKHLVLKPGLSYIKTSDVVDAFEKILKRLNNE